MKPLVIIPARAGSKGLPGKNWKLLNNKPLIQYTIEAALEVFPKEYICVTTDSDEVKQITKSLGVDIAFDRPEYLSNDTASSEAVILHALEFWTKHYYAPDYIVLLQPTSPFRTAQHISEAIKNYHSTIDIIVSVKETKANPYYILKEENKSGFLEPSKKGNFTRRQDCPMVYELNGAIYVINPKSLIEKKMANFDRMVKYEMDELSSLDIDNEMDWLFAETLIKNHKI